jgi:phosphoglucomutase
MDIIELKRKAENEYVRWMSNTLDDRNFQKELRKLGDNSDELTDSFYKGLCFGTSGMRGILGPGTNRINGYVIRRATQGLANYLNRVYKKPSVVIACDSRMGSSYFARETAAVLNGNGIRTYLFDEIAPVSLLSYAITYLGCTMGVMITASHNPKIYNGYKVYNSHGYQIVGREPELILGEIEKLDFFEGISYDPEGIMSAGDLVGQSFVRHIAGLSSMADKDVLNDLRVIYTPLNGAGCRYVSDVFRTIGFENYDIVKVQEFPDANFTTCPSPNPEKILAFDEAFKMVDNDGGDILIATDPDSDRIGAALYHDGMRTLLTGNQLGILILDYLCQTRPPVKGQIMVKSIATSPLAEKIAAAHGLKVINTLTGFKYIGETITELESMGRKSDYYYGFEESNGYLISPFICEKDGVSGAMITVEMAAYHKSHGIDLVDRLNEIYEEYGTCIDRTRNFFFKGAEGICSMESIMAYFRGDIGDAIGGKKITEKIDYNEDTGLPKANVVEFRLEDGSRLIIRPSGTESKLKVYSFETGDFTEVEKDVIKIIEKFR